MRVKIAVAGALIASLAPIAALTSAQQPPAPAQSKSKMMNGQMMGQSMMAKHQEMSKLVDQVTADMAALQDETDLATIKKKLEADHALMEQLRNHMQEQRGMMGPMMERMKMMDKAGGQAPAK